MSDTRKNTKRVDKVFVVDSQDVVESSDFAREVTVRVKERARARERRLGVLTLSITKRDILGPHSIYSAGTALCLFRAHSIYEEDIL